MTLFGVIAYDYCSGSGGQRRLFILQSTDKFIVFELIAVCFETTGMKIINIACVK